MTTSEKKRFGFQGTGVYLTSLMIVASAFMFVGAGMILTCPALADAGITDAVMEGSKVGVAIVDRAAQKDVLWLALAAATINGIAVIVAMGLTFWIAISGVKALDRIGHYLQINPWGKGK